MIETHLLSSRPTNLRTRLTVATLAALCGPITACSSDDPTVGSVSSPAAVGSAERLVGIADDGKLDGGMEGYAWVAAGEAATVESPSPCNDEGCFEDTTSGLCTRGRLPALECVSPGSWDCNYGENWGVIVGLSPGPEGASWGPNAPSTFALSYEGEGHFYLTAHVAGDPKEKTYCIDGYVSGMPVLPEQLVSECWTSGGEPLSSFADIDAIGLRQSPKKQAVDFDFCVTDVTLDAPVDTTRVIIGEHGKLNGKLDGYAWAAAGELVTLDSPNPCNQNGCFHETGGKLCASGTIPAIECPNGKVDASCNWDRNWGVAVGMNPTTGHTAWGADAASSLAFTYSGTKAEYRLNAHVAGDPSEKQYCVRDYQSGQVVTPSMFKTECWSESGEQLRSFADVDGFSLALPPTTETIEFDYCIEAITAQ